MGKEWHAIFLYHSEGPTLKKTEHGEKDKTPFEYDPGLPGL